MQPPAPSKRPYSITQHGQTRIDEYFWLRERDDPETLAYLQAENAYLQSALQPLEELQAGVFAEMKARLVENDLSVPERRGEYAYYTRMEPGRQYPLYCRRPAGGEGPEEILLDQNELAEGHAFCALGGFQVSPDHSHLAYMVDFNGSETFTLRVKDLRTGQHLPGEIENTIGYFAMRVGLAWGGSQALYYTTFDHTHRPDKVFRHRLGSDPGQDELVYHEADEAFFIYLRPMRSQAFVEIYLRSQNGTETRLLPASQPGEPVTVLPRRAGLEYLVEHLGDRFFIASNESAPNFRLLTVPVHELHTSPWEEVIPHREDVLIESLYAFAQHLVILERKDGLRQLRISGPDGCSNPRYVPFPEPAYNIVVADNPDFASRKLRFTYSSLVTPNSVVDFDMQSEAWELKKQDEIPSGYDPSLYRSERLLARTGDGTEVPISLVYRPDLRREGGSPLVLYGYGAYGFSTEPGFNANRLSLLDRGIVFALAHVRGGSEMGRQWYEQGRLLNKRNTFTDFIACAEHLIAQGWTRPEQLAIYGGSAGGLLVGAVMCLRPDLCRAVVAAVPFVDVISTMSDPTIPLTVIEYDQWGNPADRTYFDYMLSYSPYDNLRPGPYPDVLSTTGLNDPRVAFWEPAKFTARLREMKTNPGLVLLKTNLEAGHGGATGRYEALKEVALIYAFLIDRLGAR